ncbi:right-handed parallel beta-helix repeat-containing protein [Bacteroidota bacterium]
MNRFLIWIPAFLLCANLFSQTEIDSGDVSGVWTKENSPYNIHGDIYVQANQLLHIEGGVKVVFHGHYRLHLNHANLVAVGSREDSIVFTVADTNGFAEGEWDEGGWNGINFSYASNTLDSSEFGCCRFEYAKISGPDPQTGLGIIGAERLPKLLIRDCIFENNKTRWEGLIHINLSDLVIRDNVFHRNVSGRIISMTEDSPEIYGNRFDSNNCEVVLWITGWNHPRIHHNIFIRNTAHHIIKTEGNCRPRVYQNRILNNTGGIISLTGSKSAFINNLMANNDGGISLNSDESIIIHNTIANNSGTNVMHLDHTSNLLNGNIFNGNEGPIQYTKGENEPSIRYNMFDFDTSSWSADRFTGLYEHNSENESPIFCINTEGAGRNYNAEFADFNIAPQGNIVNLGDPDIPEEYIIPDLYDRERIRYGRIDFGAYEANTWSDTIPLNLTQDIILIADTIHVKGSILIPDNVSLKISARAVVLFHGHDSIIVEGNLEAIGTEDEPILFTVKDTAGFAGDHPDSGAWNGIILDNTSGSMSDNSPSIFEHCIFEYVKVHTDIEGNPDRGGVFTLWYFSNFILNNSEFRHNYANNEGHAIYAVESDFDINYCSFHHHIERERYTNGTVNIRGSRNRVDHCTFYENKIYDGASLYVFDCDLELSNSHFFNNKGIETGFGSALSSRGSDVYMYNCLVNNNRTINDAVMIFNSSRALIDNSTIVNNTIEGMFGEYSAGIGLSRTEMTIRNSILYGNTSGQDSSSIMLLEDSSDPDLYNTLIQGGLGGIRTFSGFSFTGEMRDCIEGNPFFISPTPNSGLVDTSFHADWRLLDISPCINAGTPDTAGMNLPPYDLDGNKRIMQERIDMGAYEKSGKPPQVDQQPVGGNFCAGDSIVLSINYSQSDTAFMQWQKDGSNIPGATSRTLLLYPSEMDHSGNYSCMLRNSFGTINSLPVFVNIKDPPVIQNQPDDSWVEPDKLLSLEVLLKGSQPMDIQWTLNDKDLGIDIPGYKFTPSDSSHEGAYSCIVSNVCGTVETKPANIYLAPQICMVTVSTSTGYNLIVWEKKTKAPITAYNVYRESIAAGIYDKLASLSFDDLSVFVDTVADPTVQAYIYKITALDTAGNETDADLCMQHKTIHLLVSTNPELNTTQLEWDRYYGFDYYTYKIFRSNTGSDLQEIHSMSSSFNSWTDPDPQVGELYYRIAVEKPLPCEPEAGSSKAGTGPYYHSLSNMDDNKLRTGSNENFYSEQLSIFPNPMKTEATIVIQNPDMGSYRMVIMDLAGKVVRIEDKIQSGRFTLFREDLEAGNYIIELKGQRIYRGRLAVE